MEGHKVLRRKGPSFRNIGTEKRFVVVDVLIEKAVFLRIK